MTWIAKIMFCVVGLPVPPLRLGRFTYTQQSTTAHRTLRDVAHALTIGLGASNA